MLRDSAQPASDSVSNSLGSVLRENNINEEVTGTSS